VVGAEHAVVRASTERGCPDHRVFRSRVRGKHVHGDHHRDAELFRVLNVSHEVGDASLDQRDVFVGITVRQGFALEFEVVEVDVQSVGFRT
jgi:hypothetical protein